MIQRRDEDIRNREGEGLVVREDTWQYHYANHHNYEISVPLQTATTLCARITRTYDK